MRTLRSLSSRWRHLVVSALTVLALSGSLLVLSSTQPAQAATLGQAWAGSFNCLIGSWGRQVNVYPPQMTSISGGLEAVYWSPDLYRWNGSNWVLYDGSKPWFYAFANSNGTVYQSLLYSTWFTKGSNAAIISVNFGPLHPGYYRVFNYYSWSNGASASSWSNTSGGGSYCGFAY
jgi:hypothetical protein